MTRTQHWLIALLLTTTLLCIGIIFTLLNRTPSVAGQSQAESAMTIAPTPAPPLEKTTPVNFTSMSEQIARQKATALLPSQAIESVKKVNYEGNLAYQVTTAQNLLYLNAKTGEVIVMTPRPVQQADTVQVSYESKGHEGYEHEGEHEEGEHDDD